MIHLLPAKPPRRAPVFRSSPATCITNIITFEAFLNIQYMQYSFPSSVHQQRQCSEQWKHLCHWFSGDSCEKHRFQFHYYNRDLQLKTNGILSFLTAFTEAFEANTISDVTIIASPLVAVNDWSVYCVRLWHLAKNEGVGRLTERVPNVRSNVVRMFYATINIFYWRLLSALSSQKM